MLIDGPTSIHRSNPIAFPTPGGKPTPAGADHDLKNCAHVTLLTLAAILVAFPFAGAPFDDDWSYAQAALMLAKTGHFRYNGWMTSIGLVQTTYGAILIRIFGFSHPMLVLGTAPFAMGSAALTYLLGLRTGLNRPTSRFAALTFSLSPFFIPVAASFMTDIYGCFFELLCLYLGALAMERKTIGLLLASTAVGILGGATRQSVWPAPIAVLLCFLLVHTFSPRPRRSLAALATVLLPVTAGSALLLQKWTSHQPNAVWTNPPHLLSLIMADPATGPVLLFGLLLTIGLYALPALACLWPRWRQIAKTQLAVIILFACGLSALFAALGTGAPVAPWIGNIVTKYGILLSGTDLLGDRPVILPLIVRVAVTGVLISFVMLYFSADSRLDAKLKTKKEGGRTLRISPLASLRRWSSGEHAGVLILVLFSIQYVALMAVRAASGSGFIFDRYTIPLMPLVLILFFRGLPPTRKIPFPAWAILGVFACFGIGITHDYYAQLRARAAAERVLLAAGIPRQRFSTGFETDAWQQVRRRGYVNNHEAQSPGGDLVPTIATPGRRLWWFTRYMPDVDPEYFATYGPVPELRPSGFVPIQYQTWLPPASRYLLIQCVPFSGHSTTGLAAPAR
jgi:hypothetical protein